MLATPFPCRVFGSIAKFFSVLVLPMTNTGSTVGGKKLPSKQWSCSELERGHSKLLKVKHEGLGEDELQQQIKESL